MHFLDRRPWLAPLLAFLVALPILLAFFTRFPQIYDNDSYYHLALARTYAAEGIIDELEAVRWSAFSEDFGDKEIGFHLLLVPLVEWLPAIPAGQLALALSCAALFALIGWTASQQLGRWAYLVPWALVYLSTEVFWRLVRLRAEHLSLLLVLLSLELAARRRFRWLALTGAAYALSYTAAHAFLGLFALAFLYQLGVRRRLEMPLALYPTLGVLLGLVVHPHFPNNLTIWALQSIEYFRFKGALDVGTEIQPNTSAVTLVVNLGLWALLVVLWLAARQPAAPVESSQESRDLRADLYAVGAAVFGLLYLLMSRFSLYAFPLLLLALLAELDRRGRKVGPWIDLGERPRLRTLFGWGPQNGGLSAAAGAAAGLATTRLRVPLLLALALVLAIGAPEAVRQWQNYSFRMRPGPNLERLRDREAASRAIPPGAHVAARWQQTPIYMLWAPQGRYLNVLDPIFMARPYPAAHAAQSAIFQGVEPDVPLRLLTELDSSFVAISTVGPTGRLRERLAGDPRIAVRHRDINAVYQVLLDANDSFLLKWRRLPTNATVPPGPDLEIEGLERYPLLPAPLVRVEAYVDPGRFSRAQPDHLVAVQQGCTALVHSFEGAAVDLELAPWGPTELWLDRELLVRIRQPLYAVLGAGIRVHRRVSGGRHLLTVRTCADQAGGRSGFYLRGLDADEIAAGVATSPGPPHP